MLMRYDASNTPLTSLKSLRIHENECKKVIFYFTDTVFSVEITTGAIIVFKYSYNDDKKVSSTESQIHEYDVFWLITALERFAIEIHFPSVNSDLQSYYTPNYFPRESSLTTRPHSFSSPVTSEMTAFSNRNLTTRGLITTPNPEGEGQLENSRYLLLAITPSVAIFLLLVLVIGGFQCYKKWKRKDTTTNNRARKKNPKRKKSHSSPRMFRTETDWGSCWDALSLGSTAQEDYGRSCTTFKQASCSNL